MTLEMQNALWQLLVEHQDVFAWGHDDMPEIIQHYPSMDMSIRSVKILA